MPALRGVTLEVMRGEMLCILGTSGGGKTTMLNLIGTIDTPTKVRQSLIIGRFIPKRQQNQKYNER